jgi:hypothetical protein
MYIAMFHMFHMSHMSHMFHMFAWVPGSENIRPTPLPLKAKRTPKLAKMASARHKSFLHPDPPGWREIPRPGFLNKTIWKNHGRKPGKWYTHILLYIYIYYNIPYNQRHIYICLYIYIYLALPRDTTSDHNSYHKKKHKKNQVVVPNMTFISLY